MKKKIIILMTLLVIIAMLFTGCSLFAPDDEETEENKVTVTITFESNGGSTVEAISGEPHMFSPKPEDPVKEGYEFGGWYQDEELTREYIIKFFPKKDLKLYAKWITLTNTVILNGNGGSGTDLTTFTTGETCVLPTDWVRTGYTFDGWYLEQDFSGDKQLEIKDKRGTLKYYAKWIANTYTVTFIENGGSKVLPITAKYESAIIEPIPTKKGFVFGGWYEDELLTKKLDLSKMPLGDKTVYAKWIESVTITYYEEDTILDTVVETNNNIILPNPLYTNYNHPDKYFLGWYLDKELTIKLDNTVKVVGDTNIYSRWQDRSFMPYLEKFKNHGSETDVIEIDNEVWKEDEIEFISLVDYIIFNADEKGKCFRFIKDNTQIGALMQSILPHITNNSMSIGVATLPGKNTYKVYVAKDQKSTGYLTLDNQVKYPKIQNALSPNYIPKREETFDDFKYKKIYLEPIKVETSNQLFYVMQKGLRPVIQANSDADLMFKKCKSILRKICDDSMSDVEKLYAIYTYLVTNVHYDHRALTSLESNLYDSWHLEGVLNNSLAVCDGVAKTAVVLARIEGIPCVRIIGSGHAWNKVYIDIDNNGIREWYSFDATWGNTKLVSQTSGGNVNREMFVNEHFLFTDDYATKNPRIPTNQLDIKSETKVDPYKLMEFTYESKKYDLVIENEGEAKVLAHYLHDFVNTDRLGKFAGANIKIVPDTISINVKFIGFVDYNSFITAIATELNYINLDSKNDKDISTSNITPVLNAKHSEIITVIFRVK